MDSIDKAIKFCETGVRPEEKDRAPDEPMKIYQTIETLRVNNSYYFLQFWINAKEFQRSKLTRSNFIQKTPDGNDGEEVSIEVHNVDVAQTNVSDSPTIADAS